MKISEIVLKQWLNCQLPFKISKNPKINEKVPENEG